MLRCPINVIVGKGSHEVVAVVIVRLHAQLDTLVVAGLLSRVDKVLGEKLALLVEIVAGTLGS
jgi:cytochrome b